MHELLHLNLLQEGKVLLAFSGGVDSTALFHLLLENHIAFDIAHVNYHTRPTSDDEAQNAQNLSLTHDIECFVHSVHLSGSNFEHRAREERYRFFEYLMKKHGYTYLLTAHQLNDRLEWMLMQLCRGSGLPELLGIRSRDQKEGFTLLRPLLEWDRQEIEAYLSTHHLAHFIDESNSDEHYTRNRFRHRHSTPLMREHAQGLRRSFRYLEEDNDSLIENVDFVACEELYYAKNPLSIRSLIYGIDKVFKSLGTVMSAKERENLKKEKGCVIGRKYSVWIDAEYTFVSPYIPNVVMDKGFREECRKLKIEAKLRGYLYGAPKAYAAIRQLKEFSIPLQCD
ncbi:MAG: tRNA lysidine(34) synthetase TilS [Sulfuricurvum sp.]